MFKRIILASLSLTACLTGAQPGTTLADAAEQGDRAAVRTMLKDRSAVNSAQGDGTTALHWSAIRDDLEMAKALLAAGADVKAATRIGLLTPLMMACRNGSAPMVELLLQAGSDVNAPNQDGTTPLMLAAASGKPDALKLLLGHGAAVNARETTHGQTALMFAAALNRADAIRVLMSNGADSNLTSTVTAVKRVERPKKDPDAPAADPRKRGAATMGGNTALIYAARDGQFEAAKALIEAGADVNKVGDGEKMSPLVIAILNGHYDVGLMLVNHGANPNLANDAGLTALYATVDTQWAPHLWSPPPITAREKVSHLELMRALLDHGADPNARLGRKLWMRMIGDHTWADPAGATAFWRAAQADDVPAMKQLLDHGADPKIPSSDGDTALMVAAGLGWAPNNTTVAPDAWMPAVEFCLGLGFDLNTADAKGYTALHGVAFRGDNDMVKYLIGKGARVDSKTKAGDTVADMANGPIPKSIPHPDTVALLEKLGSANSHNCRSEECVVPLQAVPLRLSFQQREENDPAKTANQDSSVKTPKPE